MYNWEFLDNIWEYLLNKGVTFTWLNSWTNKEKIHMNKMISENTGWAPLLIPDFLDVAITANRTKKKFAKCCYQNKLVKQNKYKSYLENIK